MQNEDGPAGCFGPRHTKEFFDSAYQTTPPWDIGRPQAALVELADSGALAGRVLDVGCGTGEHVLMAAERGHRAAGIDSSPRAIELARKKAVKRGLDARFILGDALEIADLREQFETVLDCGLYHSLDEADLPRFIDGLRRTIPAGGKYIMLCFSDKQPGDFGPRRVKKSEFEANFSDGWRIDSIDGVEIETNRDPVEGGVVLNAQAWRAVISRTDSPAG